MGKKRPIEEETEDDVTEEQAEVTLSPQKESLKQKKKEAKEGKQSKGGPNELRQRLDLFDALAQKTIDSIPVKFQFDDESLKEELESEKRSKIDGEKKQGKPLTAKAKHKKLKLDPDSKKMIRSKFGSDDDGEGKDEVWGRKVGLKGQPKPKKNEKMDALMEKLQIKIEQMKTKRKAEQMEAKKSKRESKKERKEKNRNKPGSKQKGFVKQQLGTSNEEKGGDPKDQKANGRGNESDEGVDEQEVEKKYKGPKIYNEEGKMIFSKFDLVAPPMTSLEEGRENKRNTKHKNKKNLKKMLKVAEEEEAKISELKRKGRAEEASQLKSKGQWRAALSRSEGEKVRNNPELIKKSIKRLDKKKGKSVKQWQERTEEVEAKMKKKQDKRTRNLDSRKAAKKDKKMAYLKKKGRLV